SAWYASGPNAFLIASISPPSETISRFASSSALKTGTPKTPNILHINDLPLPIPPVIPTCLGCMLLPYEQVNLLRFYLHQLAELRQLCDNHRKFLHPQVLPFFHIHHCLKCIGGYPGVIPQGNHNSKPHLAGQQSHSAELFGILCFERNF